MKNIIKSPIIYKKYNITIFPNPYKHKIKIDIHLQWNTAFFFHYKNKTSQMRLYLIREEVLKNIPKYKANPYDLHINIRSGDVFLKVIHHMYSQPPLCFYKKIINECNYKHIFILSNGHENPVVDKLLNSYRKIKYIHGSVEFDISIIVNTYNLVMPVSTFTSTLFQLNNNLRNLYIYELYKFNFKNFKYTLHKMIPSDKYINMMKGKWKKSKEQIDLMLNERCINNRIEHIYPKIL